MGATQTLKVVPEEGVEPSYPVGWGILSPLRLPFRHSGAQPLCPRRPQGVKGTNQLPRVPGRNNSLADLRPD